MSHKNNVHRCEIQRDLVEFHIDVDYFYDSYCIVFSNKFNEISLNFKSIYIIFMTHIAKFSRINSTRSPEFHIDVHCFYDSYCIVFSNKFNDTSLNFTSMYIIFMTHIV